jgi:hypothetical protein
VCEVRAELPHHATTPPARRAPQAQGIPCVLYRLWRVPASWRGGCKAMCRSMRFGPLRLVRTYARTFVICLPVYVFSPDELYSERFVALRSAYVLR